MPANDGRQTMPCGRLRGRRRGPFQQVPPADQHAVQAAHDGIGGQQRVAHQLGQMPKPSAHGADHVRPRLPVKMRHGDVIAAGRQARQSAQHGPRRKRGHHQGQRHPRRHHPGGQHQHQQTKRHGRDQ